MSYQRSSCSRCAGYADDLASAEDEIERLEQELEKFRPRPPDMARYVVKVTFGDGSIRDLRSNPCPKSEAEREVRELRATGYEARVVP